MRILVLFFGLLLGLVVPFNCLPKGNPFYLPGLSTGRSVDGRTTYYLVYHHEFAATYEESRLRCQSIPGGDLAAVSDQDTLDYLSLKISRPAFVKSFNLHAEQDELINSRQDVNSCLAIYPGSIIAYPKKGCAAITDSICEIKAIPAEDL